MRNPERSQGYVTDVSYPDNFFRELSPAWLNYVAALSGAYPRDLEQPFTYLELGCGFGTSTVVNAGAFSSGDFYACDFNSVHIAGGAAHADALGLTNIRFYDAGFEDLLALDLPDFDFIVVHGVYSWVAADARHAIRRVIKQKLKSGGLVYLSYNCLPGWSVEAPLRKLLLEFSKDSHGNTAQRTQQAVNSLQQFSANRLRYFSDNPQAAAAVDSYARSSGNYLTHEFLNQTWEPFYSIDIVAEMADVGLEYLGSATLADNHPMLIVDEHAATAIAALATSRQRHLAMDFAVNRRFRRDVFVHGHPHLGQVDISRHLNETVVGSLGNPNQIDIKVKVPRGEITFQDDFIAALRLLMARGSMTIGAAVTALGGNGRDAVEITRNLIFLMAAGALMPFAKPFQALPPDTAYRRASPMLARVLGNAGDQDRVRLIPSEISGSGVSIGPLQARAIAVLLSGSDAPGVAADAIESRVSDLVRLGLIV